LSRVLVGDASSSRIGVYEQCYQVRARSVRLAELDGGELPRGRAAHEAHAGPGRHAVVVAAAARAPLGPDRAPPRARRLRSATPCDLTHSHSSHRMDNSLTARPRLYAAVIEVHNQLEKIGSFVQLIKKCGFIFTHLPRKFLS
jgi:hypothetical protein